MASPEARSLAGRAAVHASWANTSDRAARTQPARDAALARFERQVDPDGRLPEHERRQRAEHARKAFLLQMSIKAAKARAAKKASRLADAGERAAS